MKILITGPPKAGKTTLIKNIVQQLNQPVVGFYTGDIREKNLRVGFSLTTFSGQKGVLSHVDILSRYTVGKYRVNLADLEEIGVKEIEEGLKTDNIIIVDEIGKMELFSEKFKQVILKCLEAPNVFLATIVQKGNFFTGQIKNRKEVQLFRLDSSNRASLEKEILALLSKES